MATDNASHKEPDIALKWDPFIIIIIVVGGGHKMKMSSAGRK